MAKTKPAQPHGSAHGSAHAARGQDPTDLVLSYLRKQNRPYSAADISSNLHNAISKSASQKILQQLVEAGGVQCKTQGKQSVYVIRQDDQGPIPTELLEEMGRSIAEMQLQVSTARQRVHKLDAEYKSLSGSLPTSEIIARISELDHRIAMLDKSLNEYKADAFPVPTAEEKEKSEHDLLKAKKTFHARQKLFKDMAGMVQEGLGMEGWEELADKLGIEQEDGAGTSNN